MKEPENKPSEAAATPRKNAKNRAAKTAIENRPAVSGQKAASTEAKEHQPVESSLVGAGSDLPAAQKRETAAQPDTKPEAASPIPAVTRPDPATAKDAKPAPAPAATESPKPATSGKTPAPVQVRKVGFFPTFLGGVVAAGLGAAATYWALPHLPENLRPAVLASGPSDAQLDAVRQAATEAARAEIDSRAEDLNTRAAQAGADAARQALAESEEAQAAEAPAETPAAAPAEIPAELTARIGALETALADLANRPAPAAPAEPTPGAIAPIAQPAPQPVGVSPEQLEALAARVNEQQARIDELAARPVVDPATAEQVQVLVKQAEGLHQSTEAANRRAQAATAAIALKAAIEEGTARDQALAALAAAGVEVAPVLAGDIPRIDELRASFPAAAREGLRAALDSQAADEGTMSKIGNFLRVQTGARSVEPREGDDADAILSRADAAVEAGEIKTALTEIAALPEPGQQAMADWTARAALWVQANDALAALAASGE